MIGVFGGSGFYSLLQDAETREMVTLYGKPSSKITIGKIGNKDVAFIARHGERHQLPPHKIPYKANIWAFKDLGVKRIIAPSAVGSLKKEIAPGDFLVPDQFVNMTHGRDDSFYHSETVHISAAEPYCPELRRLIIEEGKNNGLKIHEKGTSVIINGPRFASRAESDFFRTLGDIINMTQYPEMMLAREQEICYANISLITDYDTGLKDDPTIKPVTIEEVLRVLNENNEKIKKLIFDMVPKIPDERKCVCSNALQGAKI